MRVAADEVARRLEAQNGNLPKVILINGNEPLLVEECLDQIRALLQAQGFDERLSHRIEAGFDWSEISGAGQSMSLFSNRRLIELRVPSSLGVAGTKAVTEYCGSPAEDDVLVVCMPGLDQRQRKAKWAKVVDSTGWIVDCQPVPLQQFPHWIKHRLQSRALRVEKGVVDLLAEKLEGNLLAAAQEVDKLQVLSDNGAVTISLVNESLADQARFDVYTLTDVCLAGDFSRATRIARRLRSEGVEPVIVVWSLAREIRTLASISTAIEGGGNRAALFKQYRIWSKREAAVATALQRHPASVWLELLQQVAHLDQSVKGQRFAEVGSIWDQVEALCAAVCGLELMPGVASA